MITFKAKLYTIDNWTILRLPIEASSKLTTRGLAMVSGTVNKNAFQCALEPDGNNSHWFRIDNQMQKNLGIKSGDTVNVQLNQIDKWIEPKVPADLKQTISDSSKALQTWNDITPLARWEWIRWVNATKNPQTREKRIGVALSKLNAGNRRPCCFNSKQCSFANVSISGVLIDPS